MGLDHAGFLIALAALSKAAPCTLSGAPREAFVRLGLPRNTALFEPTFVGVPAGAGLTA